MSNPARNLTGIDGLTPGDQVRVPTESEAIDRESALHRKWYILSPDGSLLSVEDFPLDKESRFSTFMGYEIKGTTFVGEPPHIRMMREMELVDYEPGSDPGNFRWYPKGQLIKRLLEERVSAIVASLGGMRVETPIMYDYGHPGLNKYLNRFPARQYVVQSDEKNFFLRFAACFGQYLIFHDMVIGERDLPARLYELTHYSFRREQSGELSGLRRLRTFTMPDMHSLVADMPQAKEEFIHQFEACKTWVESLGLTYHVAVRFVRTFFDENRAFAVELAKIVGSPILVEMWDERIFYFVMKTEFHALDLQGRAAALSTVQIDVENAERFDIHYTASDGRLRFPLILHASISGAIERCLYALLESGAFRIAQGRKPEWPFWLAPTQMRIVPVNDEFNEAAESLALTVAGKTGIRVDVDDREEGVGRKIRDAEREWVPLILVYGAREDGAEKLTVRRRSGEQAELSLEELVHETQRMQGDSPKAPLALPLRLARRPTFRG